jgi:hypothetical protein
MPGYFSDVVRTTQHPGRQAQVTAVARQLLAMRQAGHDRKAWAKLDTLLQQFLNLGGSRQGKHFKTVGVQGQHIKGADTNGTSRPQNRDPLFSHTA